MPLTIELPEPVERRLAERAAKAGKTVELLARELIEQAVPPADPPKEKTLREIMAPFAQEFAESGMTDEEFDALIEEARNEVWEEQQKRAKKP